MSDKIDAALNSAANSLSEFASGPVTEAVDVIDDAFQKLGKRISGSLNTAAKTGELSMRNLAQSILKDLSSIALDKFVTQPINNYLGKVFESMPQYGARATGGAVNKGGAYLVGERGPELFIPNSAGQIANEIQSPININIYVPNGSNLSEVKRSSSQVAASLARAVNKGRGLL